MDAVYGLWLLQQNPGTAGGSGLCVTQRPEVLSWNVSRCTVALTWPASCALELLPPHTDHRGNGLTKHRYDNRNVMEHRKL